MVQARKFATEIKSLRPRNCSSDGRSRLKGNSMISQLHPFFDEEGVLLVGGRLCKSYLNDCCKHPVLLPKEERVTLLIMHWCRLKSAHGGRGLTLNELRSCGYWVICGNAAVKKRSSIVCNAADYMEDWLNRKCQTSSTVELLRLQNSHSVE